MAHELTLRADGRAEMAFVGETPWHKLGQTVSKGAPLSVWLKEAGMDWEAREAAPLFTPILDQGIAAPRACEGYKAIYRSDSGALLSIMGSQYQIVQPRKVLEFMREEVESGGWFIHTAGTLRGGRKLWAMASRDGGIQALNPKAKGAARDEVAQNVLIATSLDGTMRTTVQLTSIRVVCANTLAMALSEGALGKANRVEVSHRSILNPRSIKKALGIAGDSFAIFMQKAHEMSETPISIEQAREVLTRIFKPVEKPQVDVSWMGSLTDLGKPQEPEIKEARSLQRVLDLFKGEGMGADFKTAKGTRWGLLNAVTQHVDHEIGRTSDTRLDGAWFGRGAGFKDQALAILSGAEA